MIRIPILLATATAAACAGGSPTGPPSEDGVPSPPAELPAPALSTDADRYVLERTTIGWEAAIPFTYENRTRGPVFVVSCLHPTPPILEKWVGGRWVTAWSPTVPACLGPVLRVEAGERYSDGLRVFAGYPENNWHPKFDVAEPEGTYRLVWDVLSSYDPGRYPFGDPLPLHLRVSNSFELVEGD
jgi:hypothetical protein